MSLTLITNRTQNDVNRASYLRNKIIEFGWSSLTESERVEYLNGPLIGEYRESDLNRVGAAVAALASLLNTYGYPVTVNVKTNWTKSDVPRAAQMATYLENISTLKSAFYSTQDLPLTVDDLDYTGANNIEMLLLEIESNIDSMVETFLYSGGFYSGTDMQVQLFMGVV